MKKLFSNLCNSSNERLHKWCKICIPYFCLILIFSISNDVSAQNYSKNIQQNELVRTIESFSIDDTDFDNEKKNVQDLTDDK